MWRSFHFNTDKQLMSLLPRRGCIVSSCSFRQHQMSMASPKAVKHVERVDLFSTKAHLLCEWCRRWGLQRSEVSFSLQLKPLCSFKQCGHCLIFFPAMLRAFSQPKFEKGELFRVKCFSLYPGSAANQKT